MSDSKTLGRRFFEDILSKGDWKLAEQILAADIVMHHPASPVPINGREAVVGMLAGFRAGFPDLHLEVEDVIGEGDKAAVRWRATGTHTAELFGMPATGKAMNVAGISVVKVAGGQIVEDWVAEDTMGMMKQLGVIPS
jgi:steroid delta-isomerase-like uncharacterized protein